MSSKTLLTSIAAASVLVAESAFAIQFKVVTPPELMALFVKKVSDATPMKHAARTLRALDYSAWLRERKRER